MTQRIEKLADGVTLYLGDCRDVVPILSAVELVITDPPYSSGARTDLERQTRGAMWDRAHSGPAAMSRLSWEPFAEPAREAAAG